MAKTSEGHGLGMFIGAESLEMEQRYECWSVKGTTAVSLLLAITHKHHLAASHQTEKTSHLHTSGKYTRILHGLFWVWSTDFSLCLLFICWHTTFFCKPQIRWISMFHTYHINVSTVKWRSSCTCTWADFFHFEEKRMVVLWELRKMAAKQQTSVQNHFYAELQLTGLVNFSDHRAFFQLCLCRQTWSFLSPDQGVFVPKPNRTFTTVLGLLQPKIAA